MQRWLASRFCVTLVILSFVGDFRELFVRLVFTKLCDGSDSAKSCCSVCEDDGIGA